MKRLILVFIVIIMAIELCACDDGAAKFTPVEEVETETTANDSLSAVDNSYSDEKDLIQSYIDCLNKKINIDDFMKGFSYDGCIAYFIYEDGGPDDYPGFETISEILNWLSAPENKQSAIEWMASAWGELGDFSTEELAMISMKNYLTNCNYIEKYSGTAGNFDPSFIQVNDSGVLRYSIDWPDNDGYQYNLNYICVDGYYWWILCNETIY